MVSFNIVKIFNMAGGNPVACFESETNVLSVICDDDFTCL